ncbi:MAG: cupin domain-containing protein [Henriciella sp.]|uniref:cupin domain-containing protein n=1 Tax=Henriciella sp. TaxID=1968823 RepID=UPI003C7446C8
MTHTVDLSEKFSRFSETWTPKIVGAVNDMHVKLARLAGEFEWHSHTEEDELFFVVEGVLLMQFRDRTERIEPGQFLIVPRGVEHLPVTETDEVKVMLLEPATTLNTGEGEASERTVKDLEWL